MLQQIAARPADLEVINTCKYSTYRLINNLLAVVKLGLLTVNGSNEEILTRAKAGWLQFTSWALCQFLRVRKRSWHSCWAGTARLFKLSHQLQRQRSTGAFISTTQQFPTALINLFNYVMIQKLINERHQISVQNTSSIKRLNSTQTSFDINSSQIKTT